MKLSLHIPGLFAAPPRLLAQLTLPDDPVLREWQRATTETIAGGRYGFVAQSLAVQQPPLAALAWLGLTGNAPQASTLFATPVHLQAGMHDLVLFAGATLAASPGERERIAHDMAVFFDKGPAFCRLQDAMFMQVDVPLDVRTTPLHEAQGKTVRERLPQGEDARRLHGWMNELQMLLHDHAVNRDRQARGLPALNGIWLWGEGSLPEARIDHRVVFAQSHVLRGLGRLLGEARELDALSAMLPSEGHHVAESQVCIEALDADDADAWQEAVRKVSKELLQPVLDWIAQEPRAEAVLYAGDGKARRLGREGVLKRWRRRLMRPASPVVVEEYGAPE